jgi:serine/threonine-protein kinase
MAPEQVTGGALTPATDLYALGVMTYEALTGELPFWGRNVWETAALRFDRPPPHPSRIQPPVPGRGDRILAALMATDPAARPATPERALALLDGLSDLGDVGRGRAAARQVSRPPVRLASGLAWACVALVVLSAAALLLRRPRGRPLHARPSAPSTVEAPPLERTRTPTALPREAAAATFPGRAPQTNAALPAPPSASAPPQDRSRHAEPPRPQAEASSAKMAGHAASGAEREPRPKRKVDDAPASSADPAPTRGAAPLGVSPARPSPTRPVDFDGLIDPFR